MILLPIMVLVMMMRILIAIMMTAAMITIFEMILIMMALMIVMILVKVITCGTAWKIPGRGCEALSKHVPDVFCLRSLNGCEDCNK